VAKFNQGGTAAVRMSGIRRPGRIHVETEAQIAAAAPTRAYPQVIMVDVSITHWQALNHFL
jgi:hypothetical protein